MLNLKSSVVQGGGGFTLTKEWWRWVGRRSSPLQLHGESCSLLSWL